MDQILRGDTITFWRGSTFLVQGELFDSAGDPYDYTLGTLDVYETYGFPLNKITIQETDKANGLFVAEISLEDAKILPLGRSSWFKLRISFPDTNSAVVLPPIWIETY